MIDAGTKLKIKCYLKETSIGKCIRRKRYAQSLLDEEKVKETIQKFLPEIDKKEEKELMKDILLMAKRYRFSAEEFFLYDFKEKTEDERLEFISDLERIDIVENLNKAKNQVIFDDKSITYKYFGEFYKREVCQGYSGKKNFANFVIKHTQFIVKPLDASCGAGIRIFDTCVLGGGGVKKIVKDIYSIYNDRFIAEELIKQSDELLSLHPKSVNTIRVTTIRLDNHVEIIHPFLRVGRGNKVVDNGGAGGILCVFDPKTGKVFTTRDENGDFFEVAPESGESLIGFTIPDLEQAYSLVRELATVIPDNRYTGWDLAHTDTGWVLVEANARGQFVGWQFPTMKGFRKEIYGILEELGRNKAYSKEMKLLVGGRR